MKDSNKFEGKFAYRTIYLTRGMEAVVSPEDYERVNKYKWTPQVTKRGKVGAIIGFGFLHRFVMSLLPDGSFQPVPLLFVDHWNGNVFDNRRCNLRLCTEEENAWNKRNLKRRNKSSKYIGVKKRKDGRFEASIIVRGYKHVIGIYDDEEDAANDYDMAAREMLGAFPLLNFPRECEIPPVPPPNVANQEIGPPTEDYNRRKTNQRKRYSRLTSPSRQTEYIGVSAVAEAWELWQWNVSNILLGNFGERGFPTDVAAAKARDIFIIENRLPHHLNFA